MINATAPKKYTNEKQLDKHTYAFIKGCDFFLYYYSGIFMLYYLFKNKKYI